MPMSASFSAGASLTPSPVIATISPSARSTWARRSFCSAEMRAKITSRSARRLRSASSSRASRSAGPITCAASWTRPILRATASAVYPLSPVTMSTRIPAARQRAIASETSGRGGSSIPARPRNSSSRSRSSSSSSPSGSTRRAKASTRNAERSISAAAWSTAACSSGGRVVRGTSTSAAPLTYARRCSPTR